MRPVQVCGESIEGVNWRRADDVARSSDMPDTVFLPDRIEVTRPIPASPWAIFDVLRSPAGHVAIDASGMLQDYTGEPAERVGDTFVIHMDRESLNDYPLGRYDVTADTHRARPTTRSRGTWVHVPVHFYGYRPARDSGTPMSPPTTTGRG
jgi:hypothetical protein